MCKAIHPTYPVLMNEKAMIQSFNFLGEQPQQVRFFQPTL